MGRTAEALRLWAHRRHVAFPDSQGTPGVTTDITLANGGLDQITASRRGRRHVEHGRHSLTNSSASTVNPDFPSVPTSRLGHSPEPAPGITHPVAIPTHAATPNPPRAPYRAPGGLPTGPASGALPAQHDHSCPAR